MAKIASKSVFSTKSGKREGLKQKPLPSTFRTKLHKTLIEGLNQAGIRPKITIQPVPMTKLNRVIITAKQFRQLKPSERQDLVWRIVDQTFTPEEQLKISMIFTPSPDELEGK